MNSILKHYDEFLGLDFNVTFIYLQFLDFLNHKLFCWSNQKCLFPTAKACRNNCMHSWRWKWFLPSSWDPPSLLCFVMGMLGFQAHASTGATGPPSWPSSCPLSGFLYMCHFTSCGAPLAAGQKVVPVASYAPRKSSLARPHSHSRDMERSPEPWTWTSECWKGHASVLSSIQTFNTHLKF